MKFVQVHTLYEQYLSEFYATHPQLVEDTFEQQIKAILEDGFCAAHFFAPLMSKVGYDGQLILANAAYSQVQWLKQNNEIIQDGNNWTVEIVRRQIERIKPDILYLSDPISFDSKFVRSLSFRPKLILGWRAAMIPAGTDWSEFDIILSNVATIREFALKLGARQSLFFAPGFPTWIAEKVAQTIPQYDLSFCGQWSVAHIRRNFYASELAELAESGTPGFKFALYLSGSPEYFPAAVANRNFGPRYGLDFYRALLSAPITLDARGTLSGYSEESKRYIDFGGSETGTMRMFEATGVGAMLLTENFKHLNTLFERDSEVITFDNLEELKEKLKYLLEHPQVVKDIAKKGQERCLRVHSSEQRIQHLDEIIRRGLGLGKQDASNERQSADSGERRSTMILETETPTMTSDLDTVNSLIDEALAKLNENDIQGAFDLTIAAKELKKPTQDLDYTRALCFIAFGRLHDAEEALKEELRYYPKNGAATELLKQVREEIGSVSTQISEQDQEFKNLLSFIRPYTMLSEERLYSLFTLGKKICLDNLSGNFVECGVAAGGSSALLAYVIKRYSKQERWLYSFDSFEGMPEPTQYDSHQGISANATGWGTGTCSASEQSLLSLCSRLGVADVVKPVKGLFEERLPRFRDKVGMISLLHLDGDWYESTRAILDNLYDRLVNGAFLQVDDYGYWEGCQKALHEFENEHKLKFELHKIDGTGVWFQRPDRFPLNEKISPRLIKEFAEDDPIQHGVVSQMSLNERFQLYFVLRNLVPVRYQSLRFIEIGCYQGASLLLQFMALRRKECQLQGYAVEPEGGDQFHAIINKLNPAVQHLKMYSHDASLVLQNLFAADGIYPTFILVDGDHTYEGVRSDILDYWPLLAPGGVMLFHDFLPPLNEENKEAIFFHHAGNEPGIRKACEELMEGQFQCKALELPLLQPTDPTQTQAHLPLIPGVYSTIRAYQKLLH